MNSKNCLIEEESIHILHSMCETIISEAVTDNIGVSWETIITIRGKGIFEKGISYSISNGNAGIILFLIHYYMLFPDNKVKEIIKASIFRTFYHYTKSDSDIGFYNGRGGFIFVLVLAHKVLGEDEFLDKAKILTRSPFPVDQLLRYNLDSGVAGYILGILHYLTSTGDTSCLERIQELLDILVSGIKIKEKGIYWDELPFTSKPLCSFLYGNSGIVFVLQQLKKVLRTDAFDKLINEGISWEDSCYVKGFNNWPDFYDENSKIISVKAVKNLPRSSQLFKPGNTFSWAIGSPGTLLSRISLLEDCESYENSYFTAFNLFLKKAKSPSSNFTLYNGLGGVYLTLMSIGSSLSLQSLRGLFPQYFKHGRFLSGFPRNPEVVDLSLFRGEAGIGYLLLLGIQKNKQYNSILFPTIYEWDKYKEPPTLDFNNYTFMPIEKYIPENHTLGKSILDTNSYYEIVLEIFDEIEKSGLESLESRIRSEEFKLIQQDLNFLVEFLKQQEPVISETFKISDNCRIINYKSRNFLLIRRIGYVQVLELSNLETLLLTLCQKENGIKRDYLKKELLTHFEIYDIKDEKLIIETLDKEINSAVLNGVIICV